MKIKESLDLNTIIRDRADSLPRETNLYRMIKKAKCLGALIKCQEEMDEIMRGDDPIVDHTTNVGDINVKIDGTRGKGPYQPFDSGALGREMGRRVKAVLK